MLQLGITALSFMMQWLGAPMATAAANRHELICVTVQLVTVILGGQFLMPDMPAAAAIKSPWIPGNWTGDRNTGYQRPGEYQDPTMSYVLIGLNLMIAARTCYMVMWRDGELAAALGYLCCGEQHVCATKEETDDAGHGSPRRTDQKATDKAERFDARFMEVQRNYLANKEGNSRKKKKENARKEKRAAEVLQNSEKYTEKEIKEAESTLGGKQRKQKSSILMMNSFDAEGSKNPKQGDFLSQKAGKGTLEEMGLDGGRKPYGSGDMFESEDGTGAFDQSSNPLAKSKSKSKSTSKSKSKSKK